MHLVELGRKALPDGTTEVSVGMGATVQATIVVLTSILDTPGYVGMLDSMLDRQVKLETIKERGAVQ